MTVHETYDNDLDLTKEEIADGDVVGFIHMVQIKDPKTGEVNVSFSSAAEDLPSLMLDLKDALEQYQKQVEQELLEESNKRMH